MPPDFYVLIEKRRKSRGIPRYPTLLLFYCPFLLAEGGGWDIMCPSAFIVALCRALSLVRPGGLTQGQRERGAPICKEYDHE